MCYSLVKYFALTHSGLIVIVLLQQNSVPCALWLLLLASKHLHLPFILDKTLFDHLIFFLLSLLIKKEESVSLNDPWPKFIFMLYQFGALSVFGLSFLTCNSSPHALKF